MPRKAKTNVRKLRRLPPLTIVDWKENCDLRTVSQRATFLRNAKRIYRLKDREAVLFSNNACNRFRLVVCWNEMPMLIIPPVASYSDMLLSLFLQVSRFIHENFGSSDHIKKWLTETIDETLERVARCEARGRKKQKKAA